MSKFKVSVIVPIYNVYDYLEETIKSVISQTLDFEKNIELVLVNDGSPDRSSEICLKYKEMYPNNIVYVDKENSGVSDSRNVGFSKSNASYVMFLDSDDLINKKFLYSMVKFLDNHDDINLVISRVRLFEASDKWHYMDYVFKSNKKIVDINKDIEYLKYHSTGVLFRKSAIKKIKFDRNIKYGEDMKFMSEILLQNNKYGLEKNAILYYRKRLTANSAVNNQLYDKSFYLNTMKGSFMYIFKECIKKYGYVTKYFQYFMMNSLGERVRLNVNIDDVLNINEKEEYFNYFKYLLKHIDNDVIIMQRRHRFNDKIYFLKLKNGDNFKINVKYKDKKMYINDTLCNIKHGEFVKLIKIQNSGNNIKFYVKINDYMFKDKIIVSLNKNDIDMKDTTLPDNLVDTEYKDIECKPYYKERIMTFSVSKKSNYKGYFLLNDERVNYGITDNVFKHNTWPKQYKKVGNKIVYMDHKQLSIKNKYQFLKLIYYMFRDGLVVIKRNNFKKIIKKVADRK